MLLQLLLSLNLLIAYSSIIAAAEEEEKEKEEEKKKESDSGSDLDKLEISLKNDRNLDLSSDAEYEDLRAEFLAYKTAIKSLTSEPGLRRSLISTPCWTLGGICVNYKLCVGFRFLTEVPGCKDKLNVCCFTWNKYRVRDFRDEGIGLLEFPWNHQQDFGGKGIIVDEKIKSKQKKKKSRKNGTKTLALVIRSV